MNDIDRFFQTDPAAFASAYLEHVQRTLRRIDADAVGRFLQALLDARERGATVYFIGNGGSAATASHFANDLAIGVDDYEKPIRAISLADNLALISAVGNDLGFEEIFVRQLRVLARRGDVVVAISASGNSPNLVKAFEYAKNAGVVTVALTAFDGGRLKDMADVSVHVPTGPREYGPAEDAHMVLDHLAGNFLMRYVRVVRA
ncbi:MAG TPA: SIS domain-containing protein [Vicinamibacterales bacterium]|jgi:D-sedoheptulose 7-phosphate isomerase